LWLNYQDLAILNYWNLRRESIFSIQIKRDVLDFIVTKSELNANGYSDADLHKDRRRDMSIAVYIRKEYFRAVTIKDKSAHILEFQYRPQTVDVFEEGYQVFHMEYILESKTKA